MTWQQIEQKREALGLSRAALARRAGISESTIYKGFKAGGRPSDPIAKAIAAVLEREGAAA